MSIRNNLAGTASNGAAALGNLAAVTHPASHDVAAVDLERHHRMQAAMALPEAADLREQAARMEAQQAHNYLVRRVQSGSTVIEVLQGFAMAAGKMVGLLVVDQDADRLVYDLAVLMKVQAAEDRVVKHAKLAEA